MTRQPHKLRLIYEILRWFPYIEAFVLVQVLQGHGRDVRLGAEQQARGLGPENRLSAGEGDQVRACVNECAKGRSGRQLTGGVHDDGEPVSVGHVDDIL